MSDTERELVASGIANKALRVIRGEVSIGIEISEAVDGVSGLHIVTVLLPPQLAKAVALDLIDAANSLLN